MKNNLHKIIIGQLLADAHIELIAKNCRMSFSFGTNYKEYADWIHYLFKDYCTNSVYAVRSTAKDRTYCNYRLKTKTTTFFNDYRQMFYKQVNGNTLKLCHPILETLYALLY